MWTFNLNEINSYGWFLKESQFFNDERGEKEDPSAFGEWKLLIINEKVPSTNKAAYKSLQRLVLQ